MKLEVTRGVGDELTTNVESTQRRRVDIKDDASALGDDDDILRLRQPAVRPRHGVGPHKLSGAGNTGQAIGEHARAWLIRLAGRSSRAEDDQGNGHAHTAGSSG